MNLAVFLPNWVGDAVMATPALAAIRREHPAARIIGVMRPVIDDVLAGSRLIDDVLLYDPRRGSPEQRGWGFWRQLRAAHIDTVLLLPNSLRSAWWGWLSGAKRRIGYDRDLRSWLLTDRVTPKSKSTPHPVLDEYLRLTERLGCRSTERSMHLAVTTSEHAAWQAFWSKQTPELRSRGLVVCNTGGAFGPAKSWPRESFADLSRRIADHHGKTVVILCGPSEREEARWIAANAHHPAVISLADERLSIGLTKAAVAAAELMVTTDSGPRHFAAAFNVPLVTLFGPTHIAWSETHFPRSTHLQVAVPCGPCQQRVCPQGHHRCMRDLTVDQVFAAAQQQLTFSATRAA